MNIFICQKKFYPTQVARNLETIKKSVKIASRDQASVFVTPELSIPGYPALDLYSKPSFVKMCEDATNDMLEFSKKYPDMLIVFGNIKFAHYVDNMRRCSVYNRAFAINNGNIVGREDKCLLPDYDVFFENRYFAKGKPGIPFEWNGKRIGLLICEDLWDVDYDEKPFDNLSKKGVDIILSLNASPFYSGKLEVRHALVKNHLESLRPQERPEAFVYVNAVGCYDGYDGELVFDGGSFVYNKESELSFILGQFQEEDEIVLDQDLKKSINQIRYYPPVYEKTNGMSEVYDALTLAVQDYFARAGVKKAVIGLSGGIDSAVTAAIAARALGTNNVLGVTMPSEYSSEGSVNDSVELAKNLEINMIKIPISHTLNSYKKEIQNSTYASNFYPVSKSRFLNITSKATMCDFVDRVDSDATKSSLSEENLQARIRGNMLMFISNATGALVLSTGNKTELALGYCVDGNSVICTNFGMYRAKDLYIEEKDNAIVGNSIVGRHKSIKNNIVDIRTSIGTTMRVSSDHEVKVYDLFDHKEKFKIASDLKEKDLIVMEIGNNIFGSTTTFSEFVYNKKQWDFKSFDFTPPKELNFNIAKFIGVCVADGSYNVGSYRIRLSKKCVGDFLSQIIQSEFVLPSSCWSITEPDENGCCFFIISSVQFMSWLKFIKVEHGAYSKIVPDCIMKAPIEIVKGFISGVMMDSSTDSKDKLGEIVYHSVSKDLAEIIQIMLLNIGIICYFRGWKRKWKGKEFILYEIYIPSCETYKFNDGFDFLKQLIVDRIKNNLNDRIKYKASFDFIYGYSKEISELYYCLGYNIARSLKWHIKKGYIGRNTLIKYIDMAKSKNISGDFIEKLSIVTKNNIRYISITEVLQSYNEGGCEMYDFSMSGEKEYNCNCHIVHNCTLYGDMAGGLAVIADLNKNEVYELATAINVVEGRTIIPPNSFTKPPSAELAPGQTDEKGLGASYHVLSPLVEHIIDGTVAIDELRSQYGAKLVDRIVKRINSQEYKRRQCAPSIKISKKSFGVGRRIPWDSKV
jgi:NAD+ synthase (glutamine-hydrolysing)